MFAIVIALVAALTPAAIRLWRDRELARLIDDPAFAERLMASRQRGSISSALPIATALALLLVFLPRHAAWALPLAILAQMAAAFRLRKRILGETWSFAGYLWFFGRLVAVMVGFWLLVGVTPDLIARAGPRASMTAAVLLVVLIGWNLRFSDVIRVVMGARPIEDPALAARLEALASRTQLQRVRWMMARVNGGVFANAVALPHVTRPSVIFTDTLLRRLDEDEAIAVAAHELAHIEHFTPRRIRLLAVAEYAFVGVGVIAGLVTAAYAPERRWIVLLAWLVVVFSWLTAIGRARRRHETESDVRAAAMTGDAESVVRALTKIHLIARLPRRWATEFEQRATHPSLARRIQAIRASAGVPVASLAAPVTVSSAATNAAVTFHDDRLDWMARGEKTSLEYAALTDLRVQAGGGATPRLIAVGVDGRQRIMQLHQADVAVVQSALDVVDARLAPVPSGGLVPAGMARLAAVLLFLVGLIIEYPAALIAAALAAWQPVSPLLAAAGLLSILGGLGRFGTNIEGGQSVVGAAIGIAVIAGGVTLLIAAMKYRDAPTPGTRAAVWILGAAALTVSAPLLLASNVVALHAAARGWRGLSTLPIAFSVALLWRSTWPRRAVALVAAVVGVATMYVGTPAFVDTYGNDPFLVVTREASRVAVAGERIANAHTDDPESIRLSPSGRAVALIKESDSGDRHDTFIGPLSGSLTRYDGGDAVFVDDERALVVATESDATRIRLVGIAPPRVLWEQAIPGLAFASIAVDPAADRWEALGHGGDSEIARARGTLAGGAAEITRWAIPGNDFAHALASDGDRLLVERTDVSGYAERMRLPSWWRRLRGLNQTTTLQVIGANGILASQPTAFSASCQPNARLGAPPVCAAFDGSRSHVATIHLSAPLVRASVTLPGLLTISSVSGSRISGWAPAGGRALDLDTAELWMPPSREDDAWQMVVAGPVAAAMSYRDGLPTLTVFKLR